MSKHGHACSGCGKGCGSGTQSKAEELTKEVKSLVGIMSGKGGVGKSLITALLAAGLSKAGKKAAVLDADILNPTIPRLFNLQERAVGGSLGLYPLISPGGVKVMSLGALTERETDPVIWPGPIQAKAALQFWSDVVWDEVDCMMIDLPTGTGDVPQKVLGDLPLHGVIVVTTPQEIARPAAIRTVRMAQSLNVPILGLVENFSKESDLHPLTGEEALLDIPVLDWLPFDPALLEAADCGQLERVEKPYLTNTIAVISELVSEIH